MFQLQIDKIIPKNILDLLQKSVLENLLGGYSYALGAGITVMYPDSIDVTLDTLRRIDALGPDALDTFHLICAEWRDDNHCRQDETCRIADKLEAMKYYDGSWYGPRIFYCQPLSLWDMTFPLEIESRVVGILFGGQLLSDANEPSCRDVLKEYDDYIDWNSSQNVEDHIAHVRQKFEEQALVHQNECPLIKKLKDKETAQSLIITADELNKRIKQFIRFGKALQGLLEEVYESRRTGMEQSILGNLDSYLTDFDLSNTSEWWNNCGEVLDNLTKSLQIDQACIFGRKKSRYLRKHPQNTRSNIAQRILTRDILTTIPADDFIRLNIKDHKQVIKTLEMGDDETWAFHSRTATGSEVCSTLIILRGHPSNHLIDLIEKILAIICANADVAQLIFRLRDMDAQFRQKVAEIGHSFRTPFQSLALILDELDQDTQIKDNPIHKYTIETGINNILDIRLDLLGLLEPQTAARESFNLMEVLNRSILSMKPIARERGVVIVKQDQWPSNIMIHGIKSQVQRALSCLLDNATKYSYRGERSNVGGLFQVRLRMSDFHPPANNEIWVKLEISNYGIGIPEDQLDAIREIGTRADITDTRRTRAGTGLGLYIAINIIEEMGGWIHITSGPSPSATKEEIQEHHRYITTVEVALPTKTRS